MAGRHRDRGTGKHDATNKAETELGDAVADALKNAPKKAKPQTGDELRRAIEGEK